MPDTLKEEQAVLRLDNVSKNFGGVVAASDICIQLFRGEVFGLIGPCLLYTSRLRGLPPL